MDKLSLLLVAICAARFLGERPSVRDWAGIFLIGMGVIVLALRK